MAWKDLFYFSKGERRGFIIVIGIIVAGCLWVWYSKIEPKTSALETTKTEKTETKENSYPVYYSRKFNTNASGYHSAR